MLNSGHGDDPRPVHRPWHATTDLEDLAIIPWSVPPERMAALLPATFEPELFVVDGQVVALVSSVTLIERGFQFRGLPVVRLSCGQVDHRGYVQHRGEPGVWFFGVSLDHPLVHVARLLWAMPWHRSRIVVDARWDGAGAPSMVVDVRGRWGDVTAVLGGPVPWVPEALSSPSVTDPLVGWYQHGRSGAVGRYSVWHHPLDLVPIGVERVRSVALENLGLVDPGAEPLGALVARRATFDIHTPPRRQR